MPRRPPLALLAALLLGGCSDDTALPEVRVAPVADAPASCRQAVDALPQVLQDAARRGVSPESGTTAAWGDPAIVLRCGVAPGSELDDLYTFDGVEWAVHDTGATRTWTTRGRAANVEVVVPDAYRGQAELLGSLAVALRPTAR